MENILRTIFNAKTKTAEAAPNDCFCTNCGKAIDKSGLYFRFTGEFLHAGCLIGYMKKLRILDVIAPQKNGGRSDE